MGVGLQLVQHQGDRGIKLRIAAVLHFCRVVEDFGSLQVRGLAAFPDIDDNIVVWLSRIVAQDVNVFDGPNLLASSERNLFASGLLTTRSMPSVSVSVLRTSACASTLTSSAWNRSMIGLGVPAGA